MCACAYCDGQVVLAVVLLRCGTFSLLEMPLVPDYAICVKLGETGAQGGALQLNLDS